MKKVFIFFAFIFFYTSVWSCAAIAEARNKAGNSVSWTIYNQEKIPVAKCVTLAKSKLQAGNGMSVIAPASTSLNHGFFVMISAAYDPGNGKARERNGYGFSSKSAKDAELEAVKNLKKNDNLWKKEEGYQVDKSVSF